MIQSCVAATVFRNGLPLSKGLAQANPRSGMLTLPETLCLLRFGHTLIG